LPLSDTKNTLSLVIKANNMPENMCDLRFFQAIAYNCYKLIWLNLKPTKFVVWCGTFKTA